MEFKNLLLPSRCCSGYCAIIEWRDASGKVVARSLILWGSIRQKVISLSTAEAELRALIDSVRELYTAGAIGEAVAGITNLPLEVRCDSAACIALVKKGYSAKLRYLRKSVSVNLAWLRQFAASILDKVESALNRSDILTKGGVEPEAFADHTCAIGVVDASLLGLGVVELE